MKRARLKSKRGSSRKDNIIMENLNIKAKLCYVFCILISCKSSTKALVLTLAGFSVVKRREKRVMSSGENEENFETFLASFTPSWSLTSATVELFTRRPHQEKRGEKFSVWGFVLALPSLLQISSRFVYSNSPRSTRECERRNFCYFSDFCRVLLRFRIITAGEG